MYWVNEGGVTKPELVALHDLGKCAPGASVCNLVDPSKGWQPIAAVLGGSPPAPDRVADDTLTSAEMQEWSELEVQSRNSTMDMPGALLMRLGNLQTRARKTGQSL